MKSSAFVHRTVRCRCRKVSWYKEKEAHSILSQRGQAPGGACRQAGAGPGTWERVGAVGRRRLGFEAGGSLGPQGGERPGAGRARGQRRARAGALHWQLLGLPLGGSPGRPRGLALPSPSPLGGLLPPVLVFSRSHPPTPLQHPAPLSRTPHSPRQPPLHTGTASRHRLNPKVLHLHRRLILKRGRNKPRSSQLPAHSRFAVRLRPNGVWGLSAN